MGGSRGNIAIAIANSAPKINFVVQDLPDMLRGAAEAVPAEVKERVKFMVHDFFKPQVVVGDAYLFRNIFHNWSDAHVVKILQATIPALKNGAKIVVNDYLIPEAKSMVPNKEREIR